MAKRSAGQFARRENDAYWTPAKAAAPLLPHLDLTPRRRGRRGRRLGQLAIIEPCAGAGDLVRFLEDSGEYVIGASDIAPEQRDQKSNGCGVWICGGVDARSENYIASGPGLCADCFITNPPWSRDLLHPIIANLMRQLPAWLLFDSDWRHTEQATPFLPFLRAEIGIGRVKWIPDSAHDGGKDNASWYLFDATDGAQDRYPPGCLFFTRWAQTPAGYPQTMMEA